MSNSRLVSAGILMLALGCASPPAEQAIARVPSGNAAPLAAQANRATDAEAWAQFCDRMKSVGESLLTDEFPSNDRDRAEGFRHLARTVAMGLQWEVDIADPSFPALYRQNDEITKWGGPNVDNTYMRARIDGKSTYELRGDISSIEDLIVSVSNGDMHQGKFEVLGDLDSSQLNVDSDGRFVLAIGPDVDPAEGIQTRWDSDRLSIRQYYSDWETHTPAEFHLTRISEGATYPVDLTSEEMAKRLDAAARWVEDSIPSWNNYLQKQVADWAPNVLMPPRSVPGGSDDIAYGGGHFELADDEALLIETIPPDARQWSFQYYTMAWFESPDFANRQTSLNNSQTRVDSDGMVRIVMSKQDPGVQNWIDTEGRRSGLVSYRWIWTRTRPAPTTRVIKVSELRNYLPSETPPFGKEMRSEQVRIRREHVERRFRR